MKAGRLAVCSGRAMPILPLSDARAEERERCRREWIQQRLSMEKLAAEIDPALARDIAAARKSASGARTQRSPDRHRRRNRMAGFMFRGLLSPMRAAT